MTTSTTPTPTVDNARPARRRRLTRAALGVLVLAALTIPTASATATPTAQTPAAPACQPAPTTKPTVVLVHGAWADASSWSGEVQELQRRGYPVDVAPNPLRGLAEDSAYLRAYLAGITGRIVLVGHSYGGAVITDAATGNHNVAALVYVDAYIPDAGQSVGQLSGPNSALAPAADHPESVFTLRSYPGAPRGIYDTYLLPAVYTAALAADLPRSQAAVLAASQSPTSLLVVSKTSSAPAWKTIPSWDLIGRQDKVIPLAQQLAMASHAGSHVTQINSSHLSLISHPAQVTAVILAAARATS